MRSRPTCPLPLEAKNEGYSYRSLTEFYERNHRPFFVFARSRLRIWFRCLRCIPQSLPAYDGREHKKITTAPSQLIFHDYTAFEAL
jgi:hypothetical protein